MDVLDVVNAGVLGGNEATKLYKWGICYNVVGINSINAVLESAKKVNSPVIVQFSNGGAGFVAGKTCQEADVLGAISGARHVHLLAKHYGIPVIFIPILIPWIDSLIES